MIVDLSNKLVKSVLGRSQFSNNFIRDVRFVLVSVNEIRNFLFLDAFEFI